MIPKSRSQKIEKVKVNQPDLYAYLKKKYPNEPDDRLGNYAGDIIEWVIVSGGNVDVFQDNIDEQDIDYIPFVDENE